MRAPAPPVLVLLAAAGSLAGCGGSAVSPAVPGGRAADGPKLVQAYGCGVCHEIAGIHGADGTVGPSLTHYARRRYIAGKLPNTATNLVRWIMSPQAVEPGTLMPDLDVGTIEARDLAAYLYRH